MSMTTEKNLLILIKIDINERKLDIKQKKEHLKI